MDYDEFIEFSGSIFNFNKDFFENESKIDQKSKESKLLKEAESLLINCWYELEIYVIAHHLKNLHQRSDFIQNKKTVLDIVKDDINEYMKYNKVNK